MTLKAQLEAELLEALKLRETVSTGRAEEGDEGDEMVDPNQVELMVGADGQQHFDLDGEMEVNDEMRDLNRQTENMADFPQ